MWSKFLPWGQDFIFKIKSSTQETSVHTTRNGWTPSISFLVTVTTSIRSLETHKISSSKNLVYVNLVFYCLFIWNIWFSKPEALKTKVWVKKMGASLPVILIVFLLNSSYPGQFVYIQVSLWSISLPNDSHSSIISCLTAISELFSYPAVHIMIH